MTSERFNPPRAEERGPDALRELVRDRRRGPSADSVNAITARIAARVSEASSTSVRPESALASYKLPAIVFIAAGSLLLTPMAVRSFATGPSSSSSTPSTGSVTTPERTTEPAPDLAAAPPNVESAGTVSVNELPTAAPLSMPVSVTPSAPLPSPARAKLAQPTAREASVSELDVTRRAQEALASDPSRALAMADELAQLFPSGEFVQERETIAVEALARLGRKDDAIQRGRQLLRRFPRTPYAARLEKVVGQPLTSTAPPRSGDRTDSFGASTR